METVAIVSATLAAVIGFGIAILAQLGSQSAKLSSIDDGVKRINGVIDSLLIATLSKGEASSHIEQQIKRLEEYLKHLKSKENPLSREEIERFREYSVKIMKRTSLSYEEYNDFKELGERIKMGLPQNQRSDFDLLLAGLLGFAAGAELVALITSLAERRQ